MKKIVLAALLISSSLIAKEYIVDQKNKTFIPGVLNVKVGDTITFTNSDPLSHNAYTDDVGNEFDIGMQKKGVRKSVKIKKAGKFEIRCAIHPHMLIKVTATDK